MLFIYFYASLGALALASGGNLQRPTLEAVGQRIGITNVEGLSLLDILLIEQGIGNAIDEESMRAYLEGTQRGEWPKMFRALCTDSRAVMAQVMRRMDDGSVSWALIAQRWESMDCPEIVQIAWEAALDRATTTSDAFAPAAFSRSESVRLRAHAKLRPAYPEYSVANLITLMGKVPVYSAPHARMADVLMRKLATGDVRVEKIYPAVWHYAHHEEDLRALVVKEFEKVSQPGGPSLLLMTLVGDMPWQSPLFLAAVDVARRLARDRYEGWSWSCHMLDVVDRRRAQIPTCDVVSSKQHAAVDELRHDCIAAMVELATDRSQLLATLRLLHPPNQDARATDVAKRLRAASA